MPIRKNPNGEFDVFCDDCAEFIGWIKVSDGDFELSCKECVIEEIKSRQVWEKE